VLKRASRLTELVVVSPKPVHGDLMRRVVQRELCARGHQLDEHLAVRLRLQAEIPSDEGPDDLKAKLDALAREAVTEGDLMAERDLKRAKAFLDALDQ
jgi:hypothetical protein